MKFSYTDTWQDTVRTFRANASVFLAIAGVFLFLPALLVGYFAPQPEPATTLGAALADMQLYMDENWHWILLSNLVNSLGAVAIYLLLFGGGGRTVGGSLKAALPILPLYFLLSMMVTGIIVLGLFLLLVPGIYLLGRLTMSAPAMVAEGRRNPFAALGRSWELTRGKGWAVAAFLLVIFVVGAIVTMAITSVVGVIFLLAAGKEGLGPLLVLILEAALGAVLSLLLVLLFASIYRRLAAPPAATAVPSTR